MQRVFALYPSLSPMDVYPLLAISDTFPYSLSLVTSILAHLLFNSS